MFNILQKNTKGKRGLNGQFNAKQQDISGRRNSF